MKVYELMKLLSGSPAGNEVIVKDLISVKELTKMPHIEDDLFSYSNTVEEIEDDDGHSRTIIYC